MRSTSSDFVVVVVVDFERDDVVFLSGGRGFRDTVREGKPS